MNIKKGDYIELYNPAKYNFFPAKVLNLDSNGIEVKILSTGKKRHFYNYYLEQFGFRLPFISEDIINKCGFQRKSNSLIFNSSKNISIIECFQGKIVNQNFLNHLDAETRFLGFKVLKNEDEDSFIDLFKNLPFKNDFKSFQSQNDLISSNEINKFFDKIKELGLGDLDTDKIILESYK